MSASNMPDNGVVGSSSNNTPPAPALTPASWLGYDCESFCRIVRSFINQLQSRRLNGALLEDPVFHESDEDWNIKAARLTSVLPHYFEPLYAMKPELATEDNDPKHIHIRELFNQDRYRDLFMEPDQRALLITYCCAPTGPRNSQALDLSFFINMLRQPRAVAPSIANLCVLGIRFNNQGLISRAKALGAEYKLFMRNLMTARNHHHPAADGRALAHAIREAYKADDNSNAAALSDELDSVRRSLAWCGLLLARHVPSFRPILHGLMQGGEAVGCSSVLAAHVESIRRRPADHPTSNPAPAAGQIRGAQGSPHQQPQLQQQAQPQQQQQQQQEQRESQSWNNSRRRSSSLRTWLLRRDIRRRIRQLRQSIQQQQQLSQQQQRGPPPQGSPSPQQ
ncbi:hypothetical protein B0T17DRAFT_620836 [Bombardia bombarda]|uniref:Uncharacterized protein n=1 Tax=Bombardia bombarda TaxID=252184 RepID=A0AA39U2D8_9PEZI|nr:hypothetical protein B0T17DRAFT_620836 [Bombardia bombarda]